VRIGICEWTTFRASVEEELAAYRAAGAGAILEFKLVGVEEVRGKLRESGLATSVCLPAAGSILGVADQLERVVDRVHEGEHSVLRGMNRVERDPHPVALPRLAHPADPLTDDVGVLARAGQEEDAARLEVREPCHRRADRPESMEAL
jgi:hypothetical protein